MTTTLKNIGVSKIGGVDHSMAAPLDWYNDAKNEVHISRRH